MEPGELAALARQARDRVDFWSSFIASEAITSMAEVGVWRGEFAEAILRRCEGVDRYYLVDPWRHLGDWDKPANRTDAQFEAIKAEALHRTEFASDRRCVLHGTTAEVISQIPDGSLDFAYIDGDHTLRGITLDLELLAPKIRPDGWIGGDDFVANIWHHGPGFEPTLIFPYAVYFAEATGGTITAVGHGQFLLAVGDGGRWGGFHDLTNSYPPPTVLGGGSLSSFDKIAWRLRQSIRRAKAAIRSR